MIPEGIRAITASRTETANRGHGNSPPTLQCDPKQKRIHLASLLNRRSGEPSRRAGQTAKAHVGTEHDVRALTIYDLGAGNAIDNPREHPLRNGGAHGRCRRALARARGGERPTEPSSCVKSANLVPGVEAWVDAATWVGSLGNRNHIGSGGALLPESAVSARAKLAPTT